LASQEVSQKVSQKNSQKFIKKFRQDIFGKNISFSQNIIQTMPGILSNKYYYTRMTQKLQQEAGEKFAEYFIDPKMCVPVFKSYTQMEMISKLTEEHNMNKADAKEIVNKLSELPPAKSRGLPADKVKGKGITLPNDNSLCIMKLSSKDKDPKYRLQVRSY